MNIVIIDGEAIDLNDLSIEEANKIIDSLPPRYIIKKCRTPFDEIKHGVFKRSGLVVNKLLEKEIIDSEEYKPVRYYDTIEEAEKCLALI